MPLKDNRGNRIAICVGGEYDGDWFFVRNDAKTGDTFVPARTQVNRPRYRLELESDRWIFDGIDVGYGATNDIS